MAPLVSVITTVYNGAAYLRPALDSVLGQTVKDFEYLIVDDASNDDTVAILQEYARRDARIRVLRNDMNLGLPGSRNRVLPMARGKYVAWQDADDISQPARFQRIIARLEEDASIGICGSFLEFFTGDLVRGYRKYEPDDEGLRRRIFRYSPVAYPSALVRRECFELLGGFDLAFVPAEDLEMSFRIGTRFKFANVQEVLLRYRQHTASMTYTSLRQNERSVIRIRAHYRRNSAYHSTVVDRVYGELHRASVLLVPPRVKVALFDRMRNSRTSAP